jgi:phosphopantothenoylcysteine decarboxylase/phosphopantothenate--cysteine ligase
VRPFAGRCVLLGVTGGIASYKTTWLARLLHKAGAHVEVVLTRSAREFVGPVTFEALTGRPVHTDLIVAGHALEHITLAKSADVYVVAPSTADFIARAAHGNSDDLAAAILLAARCPVLLVPAMNDLMWSHAQTQANVAGCRRLGYICLDPDRGDLAAGEGAGPGRMPEPEVILAHVSRLLEKASLSGRRVVVTAGPTREAIDPVRFISNRSSGRMGVALAEAAWRRGAAVTLVHGPMEVPPPVGVHTVAVETTTDMRDAVAAALDGADALIMAAAPADFGVAQASASKIRKHAAPTSLAIEETPDILAETRDTRPSGCVIVGFALETDTPLQRGWKKLKEKGLDVIVVNDATEADAGFGVDTNRVTLLFSDERQESLPLMTKRDVADAILDRVEPLLRGR